MGDVGDFTTADLADLVSRVRRMPRSRDDAERIDRISHIESLKSALDAAQAKEAAEFDSSQRQAQAEAGVPTVRLGRGVAQQLALARRVSPWQAQRWLGYAKILISELPATFAVLAAGETTQWPTMLIARETAVLSREDRAVVDAELAPRLSGWGSRKVEAEARKAAYRLDPAAAVARARKAESERRVGVRPAPDTMCWLSALLPVAQGVAAYAALSEAANSCTAAGDERGRGQIMADTLVERLTGQQTADAVGVEIVLVMHEDSLLNDPAGKARLSKGGADGSRRTGWDVPAWVQGYGPVPAGWARELAHGCGDNAPVGPRWLRRLYTRRGRPVELESTRRLFTEGQQRFLRLRDQICRTPWCDAEIRHADHVDPHDAGGPTHTDNGQGLCAACNFAKQALGWVSIVEPDGTITIQTPTGHRYRSRPPNITDEAQPDDDPPDSVD